MLIRGNSQHDIMLILLLNLELQVNRLTLNLLKDVEEYFGEKYAGEYLRPPVKQMRVIPIQKSITAEHRIGTYDELRDLMDGARWTRSRFRIL